ncbi:MAG: redox-regulated ATPase YchF [Patescibacteria group bacterium]
MSLSVGIVGLPNVGKSTLFNALLKKQAAYVANFPFATIEPNVGVVPVPEPRLDRLAQIVKESEQMADLPPKVPATVEFLDIAGLIAGAHKGEGLGNKFLSHIRETSVICHVLRAFTDPEIIREGSADPQSDFETVETELKLADLQTLEKQAEPKGTVSKDEQIRWRTVAKLREALQRGRPAREVELNEEEQKAAQALSLLTAKPILIALNVDESRLKQATELEEKSARELGVDRNRMVTICAKTEAEMAELSPEEQEAYLREMGAGESGLEKLVRRAYATLGLINFLTAGVKEVRAWTITVGLSAQQAAGVIHSDFEKNFIKADVVDFKTFVEVGGWQAAREQGKVRSEGKEYLLRDGEVVEFKIGAS